MIFPNNKLKGVRGGGGGVKVTREKSHQKRMSRGEEGRKRGRERDYTSIPLVLSLVMLALRKLPFLILQRKPHNNSHTAARSLRDMVLN